MNNSPLIKIAFRLLVLPFVVGILIVTCIRHLLVNSVRWVGYGGEVITYAKEDQASIHQIYTQLKLK